jgi:hypothetical protein
VKSAQLSSPKIEAIHEASSTTWRAIMTSYIRLNTCSNDDVH